MEWLFRFQCSVSGLSWVANDEATRWFLVLRLNRAPNDSLNTLLGISNEAAKAVGQMPLYTKPQSPELYAKRRKDQGNAASKSAGRSVLVGNNDDDAGGEGGGTDMSSHFHNSIAWTLSPPSQALVKGLDDVSSDLDMQAMAIGVNSVKLKIGNSITSIALEAKVDTTNKIIEK